MAANEPKSDCFPAVRGTYRQHEVTMKGFTLVGPGGGRFKRIPRVIANSEKIWLKKNQKDKKVGVLGGSAPSKPLLFCLSDFWRRQTLPIPL